MILYVCQKEIDQTNIQESQLVYSKEKLAKRTTRLAQVLNIKIGAFLDSKTSSKSETKYYQVGL